ncbi:MAG: PolC-type DNA polymerase III [Selenomonadaceae bacterium]|nr:PolC-type DNA polymerase III [Selenomonadaceae bacterium]
MLFRGDAVDKYELKVDDGKNFGSLFFKLDAETSSRLDKCTLKTVFVTPAINLWEISLRTEKDFDKKFLDEAAELLTRRYNAKIEFTSSVSIGDEIPAETDKPKRKRAPSKKNAETSAPAEKSFSDEKAPSAKKILGKKISGSIIPIEKLDENSGSVVICGEIGSGDKNGVNLRETKTGTVIVSFSVTDKTDGISCKKFFKGDKHDNAKVFAAALKSGSLVKIAGKTSFDDYAKETIIFVDSVETLEQEQSPRIDTAEVKRTELHVHTTMSAMDAVIPVEKLIATAAAWGWKSVAVTDHGVIQAFPNAAGAAEKLAKKGTSIKIIYGMEGYLVGDDDWKKGSNHIIILAKNKVGLGNLYRLVSISQLKFMYYRPRIPKSLLAEMREGLIIGSACEAGELIQAIVAEKSDAEIEEIANFYDYLEIQPFRNNDFMIRSERFPNINGDEDLRDINRKVAALAKKLGKPLVATTDAHFLNPEDAICRSVLMAGKKFSDVHIDKQPPLFLRTTEEMLKEFDYLGAETAYEAVVTNPNKIADEVEFLKPIPDGLYSPQVAGAETEIRETSYAKARQLYGQNLPPLVEARLEQELKPIIGHGFAGLYLIAQRLVKKSNDDGYLVGSRGSVGSSFVATLIGITEVNPLPPHYRCPKCKYSEFFTKGEVGCGYDLPKKICPVCGHPLIKDGHDIPFAVFLGFDGDKVPDIDLNFSGEYQATAHKYTEVLFGKHNVYRAGTISTVAEKTSFGLVKKYFDERGIKKHGSFIAKIAAGCQGVKRTTGQHPAGIMVVPRDMDIHYFSPIQFPADNKDSGTITTHFDYHSISSRLVKLDILGHVDPTMIKMLEKLTHRDPKTIPLDDKPTLSLFSSTDALGVSSTQLGTKSGTYGIPEFRTGFTRNMIDDTHPDCFSDLVRISGFSHGTDVWLGNAQDLIKKGTCTLKNAISARDDIMMYLIHHGVDALKSFKTMESVRKGKGIKADDVADLKNHDVPDWYIDSCQKIKYLFPRAHATAYVMMAYRIAWCKVHYPLAYYAAYFSKRTEKFDANEVIKGEAYINEKLSELDEIALDRKLDDNESDLQSDYQVVHEFFLRGFKFERADIYESAAEDFIVKKNSLLMSLSSIDGVSEAQANSIVAARQNGEFSSIEDLKSRTGITRTTVAALKNHGCLKNLSESNQLSLF